MGEPITVFLAIKLFSFIFSLECLNMTLKVEILEWEKCRVRRIANLRTNQNDQV